MRKTALFAIFSLVVLSPTVARPLGDWSAEEIGEETLRYFPEAYRQFLMVSFELQEQHDNPVIPSGVEFLVPARHFEETLTDEVIRRRADELASELAGFAGCTIVETGETREYAWHSWPDRVVRKISILFNFYC